MECTMFERVIMLHYLTERLIEESETVRAAINENPREMALEPCGKDKQQRTYYYMDDFRLYREVKPTWKNKSERRVKLGRWEVVCKNREDWETLLEAVAAGRTQREKELHEELAYIWEAIEPEYAAKERAVERAMMLEMMPRKRSSRIRKKELDRVETKKAELEEKRRREEERQRLKEQRKREVEERKQRAREERIRKRELLAEQERAKKEQERLRRLEKRHRVSRRVWQNERGEDVDPPPPTITPLEEPLKVREFRSCAPSSLQEPVQADPSVAESSLSDSGGLFDALASAGATAAQAEEQGHAMGHVAESRPAPLDQPVSAGGSMRVDELIHVQPSDGSIGHANAMEACIPARAAESAPCNRLHAVQGRSLPFKSSPHQAEVGAAPKLEFGTQETVRSAAMGGVSTIQSNPTATPFSAGVTVASIGAPTSGGAITSQSHSSAVSPGEHSSVMNVGTRGIADGVMDDRGRQLPSTATLHPPGASGRDGSTFAPSHAAVQLPLHCATSPSVPSGTAVFTLPGGPSAAPGITDGQSGMYVAADTSVQEPVMMEVEQPAHVTPSGNGKHSISSLLGPSNGPAPALNPVREAPISKQDGNSTAMDVERLAFAADDRRGFGPAIGAQSFPFGAQRGNGSSGASGGTNDGAIGGSGRTGDMGRG